jgi:hypothetical protein
VSKEAINVRALFPELELIGDAALKDSVIEIWEEIWALSEYERLEDVRVSLKIDYPQIKHCQGIVRGAVALAPVWEQVHGVHFDRDVLVAAALLMDVSKLVETKPKSGGGNEQTELGRALPHAVYAAHLALQKGLPLSIVHVLTAHSPNGGKAPNTPEAHLLDWIDQADISAFGFDIWRRKVVHYQP